MMRIIFLGIMAASWQALSQPVPVALQEHLKSAEAHNFDRRIASEQRKRSEAEYHKAWTGLLPSVALTGAWTHNQYEAIAKVPDVTTGTLDEITLIPKNQLDANLRIMLPIIDTRLWFGSLASSSAKAGALHQELFTRNEVRRAIISSFYAYVSTLALHKSAEKSAAVAERQAQLAAIRFETGTATKLEMLRSKAEFARTQQVVANTKVLLKTARRNLTTLSGRAPPATLALPEDDTRPEASYEELAQGVHALPAVRAASKNAEAASHLADATRLTLVPRVAAQFTERLTNATGFQGASTLYNLGLTFSWQLDVPTFQQLRIQGRTEAVAQLMAEKSRQRARDIIFSDWQHFNAALAKIKAARAQVTAASHAARTAENHYSAGTATQLELITAQRDLFSAEVNLIQARSELAKTRLLLHISAGLPLNGRQHF